MAKVLELEDFRIDIGEIGIGRGLQFDTSLIPDRTSATPRT
jgi:hypothetical protein